MHRVVSAILLVAVVAACSGDMIGPTAPQPSLATVTTRTEIIEPINTEQFSVFNPCTNENIVRAVGFGHLTRTEQIKSDGVTIIRGKIVFEEVIGFGELTGMEYDLKNTSRFKQEIDLVEGGIFSQRVSFKAVTDGPTMVLTSLLVIEFPPGLAPVVTVQEVSTECRGN